MSGLTVSAALALALRCTPTMSGMPIVPPGTLLSVAMAESHLDPLAVHTNRNGTRDFGIGQINEDNLARLGLTAQSALDPCLNLAASARVLQENYAGGGTPDQQQSALRATLAAYNAGPRGGPDLPYVAGVERAALQILPEISVNGQQAPTVAAPKPATVADDPDDPRPPAWDMEATAAWRDRHEPNAETENPEPAVVIVQPTPDKEPGP